jgi:hypothetical protein
VFELTSIYCPECGGAVEDMPPESGLDRHDVREVPGYRHVSDRSALCEVPTRNGDQPADPVERDEAAAF